MKDNVTNTTLNWTLDSTIGKEPDQAVGHNQDFLDCASLG